MLMHEKTCVIPIFGLARDNSTYHIIEHARTAIQLGYISFEPLSPSILCVCQGLSEPCMLANGICTEISCAGSITVIWLQSVICCIYSVNFKGNAK